MTVERAIRVQRILACLRSSNPIWVSAKAVSDSAGIDWKTIRPLLDELVEEKILNCIRTTSGKMYTENNSKRR